MFHYTSFGLPEVLFGVRFILRYNFACALAQLICFAAWSHQLVILAFGYVSCLLLQRSTMFQCHLPTGTARYRSLSTSVNYSPEINFTNSCSTYLFRGLVSTTNIFSLSFMCVAYYCSAVLCFSVIYPLAQLRTGRCRPRLTIVPR